MTYVYDHVWVCMTLYFIIIIIIIPKFKWAAKYNDISKLLVDLYNYWGTLVFL